MFSSIESLVSNCDKNAGQNLLHLTTSPCQCSSTGSEVDVLSGIKEMFSNQLTEQSGDNSTLGDQNQFHQQLCPGTNIPSPSGPFGGFFPPSVFYNPLALTLWSWQNLSRIRRPRTTFTSEQLIELEQQYLKTKYLSRPLRYKLAQELGLTETQIKIWFQSKWVKLEREGIGEI